MAYAVICETGPFPGTIESAIDRYFSGRGALSFQPANDISDTCAYRSKVVTYWHEQFGAAVTYEPNVRGGVNSVKLEMLGNGRFPEGMKEELVAMLATARTPPAACPPAGP